MFDEIERPSHYVGGRTYEPIEVIKDWDLSFDLGNVVKYISRAGRKHDNSYLNDLKKARYYLEHEIKHYEQLNKGGVE